MNRSVGEDEVEAVVIEDEGTLAHAVADDFPAAEFDFVAVAASFGDEIAFDLNEEIGVGEANLVSYGWAEHVGVLTAGEAERHGERRVNFADYGSRGPLTWALRPVDFAAAGKADEVDFAGVARFEADGGAGWDIEAESAGGGTVEGKGGVYFREMEVTPDLDWPIACVGDLNSDFHQSLIGFGRVPLHLQDGIRRESSDGMVNGYEFGSVWEGGLGLNLVDHVGDAFHNVFPFQQGGSVSS